MLDFIHNQKLRSQLIAHFSLLKTQPLATFCETTRPQLQFQLADLDVDLNHHFINTESLALFTKVASDTGLSKQINALFTEDIVNQSEQKPANHTHCRTGEQVTLQQMTAMAKQITQHDWCGISGEPFTDVVVIGMGGSALGPKLLLQALAPLKTTALNFHILDNIAEELTEEITALNLDTTLFIVVSKSFTTPETLLNAQLCLKHATQNVAANYAQQHVIAITSCPEKATELLGVPNEHILSISEFVGGRYSIWSTVGFPILLALGADHFKQFLRGAEIVDQHFKSAPTSQNIPILMAMLSVIYSSYYAYQSHIILPYSEALRTLPAYLQQLVMESNGKSVTQQGEVITYPTTGIVWGEKCSSAQHSFFQFLHQGTQVFSADLILPISSRPKYAEIQTMQVNNCLAQSKAFVMGQQNETSYKNVAGNRPHSIIKLLDVSPLNLGALLAIYEHKTFSEAVIWNINPFDQWGIDLGKQLTKSLA